MYSKLFNRSSALRHPRPCLAALVQLVRFSKSRESKWWIWVQRNRFVFWTSKRLAQSFKIQSRCAKMMHIRILDPERLSPSSCTFQWLSFFLETHAITSWYITASTGGMNIAEWVPLISWQVEDIVYGVPQEWEFCIWCLSDFVSSFKLTVISTQFATIQECKPPEIIAIYY